MVAWIQKFKDVVGLLPCVTPLDFVAFPMEKQACAFCFFKHCTYLITLCKKTQFLITAHCRRLRSNFGEINVGHAVYYIHYGLQTYTGHLDYHGLRHPTFPVVFRFSGHWIICLWRSVADTQRGCHFLLYVDQNQSKFYATSKWERHFKPAFIISA